MDNSDQPIVGTVNYNDSDETLSFTDPDEYLNEIKEAFYYRGINGWSYHTVSNDPDLKLAAYNLARNEFGLEPRYTYLDDEDEKQRIENNRSRISSDMPEIIDLLTGIEKDMDGSPGQIGAWMRISYEINEDFEYAPVESTRQICEAFRDVRHRYGNDIARELYNTQARVLPDEIRHAADYLHHGGQWDHLDKLASFGVFMDDYNEMDYDALHDLINHMNGGGSVEDYYSYSNDAFTSQMQL